MNSEEFKVFWNKCIKPTFDELAKSDDALYLREGSIDSLCRRYNDIKNNTKKLYMKNSDERVKLDRHKIASCIAKAIIMEQPIYKKVDANYSGNENEFVVANEVLAFLAASEILKAYINLKLEKENAVFVQHKKAYEKICEDGFVFPDTIMGVDYVVSVCWAWHHNVINGHFDVLGTANLFFMIENYSLEVYKARIAEEQKGNNTLDK